MAIIDIQTYHRLGKRVWLSLILCVFSLCAYSAPKTTVTANLDSTTLLMGELGKLTLSVDKPADVKGIIPLLSNAEGRPYVTLLDDTIELSTSITTDTAALANGMQRIKYHIPVQVFDSGYYEIPGFQYVAGSDTVFSNPVSLKVVPVKAAADDEITDYTDVENPAPGSWLDNVPDWVLNYWWALLIGLLALAGLIFLFVYWLKHRNRQVKKIPDVPPYEEAVRALDSLRDKQLWQHGENELYFVELTNIIRRYLLRRFAISAPEMTTTQFLEEAGNNPKLAHYSDQFRRLLQLADFIKFAKGQSLPSENEEAFTIVRKFVEDTRPTKEELENERKEAKK
ncbi:MAG: DUF4381 family protein [Prevotella sp.]|nr:DUF4381 family protein [Prevotella sp.]MCM1074673.1 DUF4381 family protein [Ruminococcus sp.]